VTVCTAGFGVSAAAMVTVVTVTIVMVTNVVIQRINHVIHGGRYWQLVAVETAVVVMEILFIAVTPLLW